MKRARPASTQSCAASPRFNKYRTVPAPREKMPSSKRVEPKTHPPRKVVLTYVVAAAAIIVVVYYLPNYFFLEKLVADHAAVLLNAAGLQVQTELVGENVLLANIKIVKDCTGVQVIAVFLGMIILSQTLQPKTSS